jgi:FkbM family methyltransferase
MPENILENLFESLTEKTKTLQSEHLLDNTTEVIIYGAGNVGRDVSRILTASGILVKCFLDQKAKPHDEWAGVSIIQPDDVNISPENRKNITVVIGIFNAFVDIPPIINRLKALGYSRVINFLDFYDYFSSELGERYWLTDKSFYSGLESLIEAGYKVWADDISRDLYASILQFRFTNDYAVLPTPDYEKQYFPLNIPQWKNPLRFVDCGAYDGDTLKYLLKTNLSLEAYAAFEPDQTNFVKLANYCMTNKESLPETISLFPCGVSHSTEQLRFSSGQDSGSHTSITGEDVIQCVSLDEALLNFRPNLIKMDIEGAEYDALQGAINIIKEYHPGLAICLYHRPDHLWQIPLYIKEMFGGDYTCDYTGTQYLTSSDTIYRMKKPYNLYLRLHALNGWELTMYAVPSEWER